MRSTYLLVSCCILITILSIVATTQLEQETPTVAAGNFVTYDLLRATAPSQEQLFGQEQIEQLLEQRHCAGLRVYYSGEHLFIVGTDLEGNDLPGSVLSFGLERVGERNLLRE